MDIIEPVPVGTHGGDLLQHVHDGAGLCCGTILWEFKRTKKWCDAWLPKLKQIVPSFGPRAGGLTALVEF